MARKKYSPSRRDLSKAWTVKKNGGQKKDICSRLGITIRNYEDNAQKFNAYFRQKRSKEQHDISTLDPAIEATKIKPPDMKKGETKLTPNNIDYNALQSYAVLGYTQEKIAGLLGVTRSTFFTFLKKHPEIKEWMDNAVERAMDDIYRNGLLLLCKQHSLPDTHFASYMGEIVSQRTTRHFNPNLGAIKYMFANKLGWATEPKPEQSNNKGAILKMLDEINNGEEHKDEEKN